MHLCLQTISKESFLYNDTDIDIIYVAKAYMAGYVVLLSHVQYINRVHESPLNQYIFGS